MTTMVLRDVVRVTEQAVGGTLMVEFTLDCGHKARRNVEQIHLRRLLCHDCGAAVSKRSTCVARS